MICLTIQRGIEAILQSQVTERSANICLGNYSSIISGQKILNDQQTTLLSSPIMLPRRIRNTTFRQLSFYIIIYPLRLLLISKFAKIRSSCSSLTPFSVGQFWNVHFTRFMFIILCTLSPITFIMFQRPRDMQSTQLKAVTVMVRLLLQLWRACQPNDQLGPIFLICLPSKETMATPYLIAQKELAGYPQEMMTQPGLQNSMLPMLAMACFWDSVRKSNCFTLFIIQNIYLKFLDASYQAAFLNQARVISHNEQCTTAFIEADLGAQQRRASSPNVSPTTSFFLLTLSIMSQHSPFSSMKKLEALSPCLNKYQFQSIQQQNMLLEIQQRSC